MSQLYLVKAMFFGSTGVYTYMSITALAEGDQVTVATPNGETKVVRVVTCEPTTPRVIAAQPYQVKPIKGLVIPLKQNKTKQFAKVGKPAEDSPV
jgi:hypothetical protein